MGWIEIIKVQTGGIRAAEDCQKYLKTLEQGRIRDNGATIKIYTHATFLHQYMVELKWNSKQPGIPFSKISGIMINELKNYGLVDHSVWTDFHN